MLLRKSQPNLYRYVKKIEAQAKMWFSYKKTFSQFNSRLFILDLT